MPVTRTAIERSVVANWKALPYQAHCGCATCGRQTYCCGTNPDSRVCVVCFEFEHGERPPNYRRRALVPEG